MHKHACVRTQFARARSGARDTLAAAASVGDNANAAALQAAATAAALKQADPAGPPHKARAHATSSTDASLNSQAAFAAAAASSSSSSSSNSGNAGNAIETGPATATQPSPAGDMFTETLPFAGAVAGAGGRVWDRYAPVRLVKWYSKMDMSVEVWYCCMRSCCLHVFEHVQDT